MVFAAVLVVTARSATTRAQPVAPRSWELAWTAPASCPSGAEVRAEVDRLAGTDADAGQSSRLYARASVEALRNGSFRLALRTTRGSERGARDLEAESCPAVARAASLILALTLNPRADVSTVPAGAAFMRGHEARGPAGSAAATGTPVETIAPAAAPTTTAPTATAAARRARSTHEGADANPQSLHWTLGVALAGELGSLPGVGPGVAARAGVYSGALGAEIAAGYWFPRRATWPDAPTAGVDLDLLGASLLGCYRAGPRAVRVGVCAGVEIGLARAWGFGVLTPGRAVEPWLGPALALHFVVPVAGPLALRVDVGAMVPAIRPRYVLRGLGSVYQPGIVAGRASLGVELTF